MFEWLSSMENTKPLALVIFFVTFVGILFYVFTGKKRSERLESYKDIPFLEDGQSDKLNKKDQDNG
jgi:cbb3-type cytochrome oxidase subunit 3